MGFFDKMERKLGRYAIPNLILYLLILYIGGFLLTQFLDGGYEFYVRYLSLDWSMILKGQVWRLITYVMFPPSTGIFWFALMCFIYYSLGKNLEQLWGTFYFNVYVFTGILANILASLLVYVIAGKVLLLTTDNLYMSFLLAFAVTMPDAQFYLYMIIPIRAKAFGIFYGCMLVYDMIRGGWTTRVAILASIANFLLFFLVIKRPIRRVKQAVRRAEFTAKVHEAEQKAAAAAGNGARHRCAVCGRTEKDDPNLEFRFCSKCAGGREYCMDHLYTHIHVTDESK